MGASNLRALYLMDIFRQETDEAHRLTVPQLAGALAERSIMAERKSLYRDIQGLIDYGMDIRKTASGYYLAGRTFLPSEIEVLAECLRSASFLSHKRSEDLEKRLRMFLSRYQAQSILAAGFGSSKASDDETLRAMEAIKGAISAHCQITFVLRDSESQGGFAARRLRASPYGLIFQDGLCCLVCNLEGSDCLTTLSLSCISAVLNDAMPWRHFSQCSSYTTYFDAKDYALSMARFCEDDPQLLRLACTKEVLYDVLNRLQVESPSHKQGDGRYLIEAQASPSPRLIAWLMSFGPALEVLEPAVLREGLRQVLCEALALYENEPNHGISSPTP